MTTTRLGVPTGLSADPAIYPLTVFFDGGCPICSAEMHNLGLRNTAGLLRFVDIAQPGTAPIPAGPTSPDHGAMMTLMHVQRADGAWVNGAAALRLVYAGAQLRGVARLMNAPVLRQVCDWAYPLIARHRYLIPRPLVRVLFETRLRRAAERRAGAVACSDGQCAWPDAAPTSQHPHPHPIEHPVSHPKE
jgi:predicted DCC family thiol-disulfide oxidoreductase YuxK